MTLRARRILSLTFILLFIVIAPAIILHAAGFKLSKNGFFIQKTGMFIIDSNPKGAKIFINGKVQKNFINSLFNKDGFIVTPAKIKNLLPGEYDLTLELKGYLSWQKKLTINPGSSTFAENVYLFKNDLPVRIFPAEIKSIYLSPGKNRAIILSGGQITFYNLADETKKSASQTNLKEKKLAWSGDSQRAVIDDYLYNFNDLKIKTDLNELIPEIFNYKWNNNALFFQDQAAIYQLSKDNLPIKIIGGKKFNDFLVKDRYLYLINNSESTAYLEAINIASGEQLKKISLPASNNYVFINQEQTLLNLYDQDKNTLYLVDPLSPYPPLVETINNIKTAFWADGNNLLYAGDYEIWLYNLPTEKKTLITRLSEKINGAVVHPNKNYIIFSTGQTLNAIELDEREKRNIAELARFDSIGFFTLNDKGNILYFSGKIGGEEGLYKLLMR